MGEVDLIEYIWRNCYQIVVWTSDDLTKSPNIFGSGFFLNIEDDLYFITADHVIHYNDYTDGIRTGNEYQYAILNNVQGEGLSTGLTTIFGFNSLESYSLEGVLSEKESIEVAMIPDMKDVAFSKINSDFPLPFLTHELQDKSGILVSHGLQKCQLQLDSICEPNKENKYIILGVVKNIIIGDIKWNRCNAIYYPLKYIGKEYDLFKFQYTDRIITENWEGLSGSPFFQDDGSLIGMLIRVSEEDNLVWVMPIKKILDYIKMIEKIEAINNASMVK